MEHMGGEPATPKLAGIEPADTASAADRDDTPPVPTCKFCGAEREIIEDQRFGEARPRYIFKMCECMGTGYIRSGAVGERRDY